MNWEANWEREFILDNAAMKISESNCHLFLNFFGGRKGKSRVRGGQMCCLWRGGGGGIEGGII